MDFVYLSESLSKEVSKVSSTRESLLRQYSVNKLREAFLKICDRLEVEHVIEIGAYDASLSRDFLKFYRGSATAFEANPFVWEHYSQQVQAAGVKYKNAAVGAKAGSVNLHIPLWGKEGDLRPLNASVFPRVSPVKSMLVEVTMTTIDDEFCSSDESSFALWIDVEGATLQVLRGSNKLLSSGHCSVVVVEVEERHFWMDSPLNFEVNDFLLSKGYLPLLRDLQDRHQYNVLYVKSQAAAGFSAEVLQFLRDLESVKFPLLDSAKEFQKGLYDSSITAAVKILRKLRNSGKD
jgi:FkbM family methyltransferase